MKYRTLDETGDYTLGRRGFLEGRAAVAQAIRTRLLWLSGEWWENVEEGLPLFESILGAYQSPETLAAADLLISERIASTKGVTELTGFTSGFSNRTYSAMATADTEYGAVEVEIGGGPDGLLDVVLKGGV